MSSVTPETTPLFLITNAGLAAASVAMPEGPYIHIVGFQIGSGYGYTPTSSQTSIQGTLLYSASPTSYQSIGNNTLDILCEIPPTAGPFQFGEVALFLADADGNFSSSSVMFCIAVFETPQTKFSSLGTNVVSSYDLNCLLKLQQSTAVFQISDATVPPAIYNIFQWSDVYPPDISANPSIPQYLVKELNSFGDASILANATVDNWSIESSSYARYYGPQSVATMPVVNSSTTWIQIASSYFFANAVTEGAHNRRFLVQTATGFWRSVSSIVVSGSNLQLNLNCTNDGTYNNSPLPSAPTVGSEVQVYCDLDGIGQPIYYSQLLGTPPAPPVATPGTPGLAYGGAGTYMPGGGAINAYGLLQSPSTLSGRPLTSADDLNNIALPSGLYNATTASPPANMPFSWDAMIWIHNLGNGTSSSNGADITQLAFPWDTGGGPNQSGLGGYPMYFRQGSNSGANWTNWMPLATVGRKSLQSANFESQYTSTNFIPAGGSTHNIGPLTFTPATYGQVMGIIIKNNASSNGTSASSAVSVTSSTLGATTDSDHTQLSTQQIAVQQVAPGDTVTIAGSIVQDAGGGGPQMGIKLTYVFIPQW